jgi:hypothetical protein
LVVATRTAAQKIDFADWQTRPCLRTLKAQTDLGKYMQQRDIDITKIDANGLRQLMTNARRLGRTDVYWKAFGQLCVLQGISESDPLHRDFAQTLAAYEELLTDKNGRTTRASRTRQKLARKGVEQSLEDWALATQPTEGFALLMDNELEHLTGEHLVIKYSDRFSAEAVKRARVRIESYRKLKS